MPGTRIVGALESTREWVSDEATHSLAGRDVVGSARVQEDEEEGRAMGAPEIKEVAVIGAGLMGHGIAQEFALAGFQVRLQDVTEERVRRGIEGIRANLDFFVQNELARPEQVEPTVSRLKGFTDLAEAVEGVDFVLEAVSEDLKLKQELFGRFEHLCPKHTILASNTSGLSVNRIAEGTTCPERVIVAHHWNPPHLIPLVEVVPAERTSVDTVELTCKLLRRCGKQPVVLNRDVPGFIGNRLQFALYREAMSIVERGIASPEAVDAVVELTFGRRLPVTGPIKSGDLAGLDVFLSISEYLFKDIESSTEPPRSLAEAVKRGDLGVKTGKGVYDWTPESIAEIKAARERELVRWLKRT